MTQLGFHSQPVSTHLSLFRGHELQYCSHLKLFSVPRETLVPVGLPGVGMLIDCLTIFDLQICGYSLYPEDTDSSKSPKAVPPAELDKSVTFISDGNALRVLLFFFT